MVYFSVHIFEHVAGIEGLTTSKMCSAKDKEHRPIMSHKSQRTDENHELLLLGFFLDSSRPQLH